MNSAAQKKMVIYEHPTFDRDPQFKKLGGSGFSKKATMVPIKAMRTLSGDVLSVTTLYKSGKNKKVSFESESICLLKNNKDSYYVVTGLERIFRLADGGFHAATCIVYEGPSEAVADVAEKLRYLSENKDLHFFDVADVYSDIISIAQISQKELAMWLSVSQPSVGNKLRLTALASEVRRSAIRARLTERHCRALLDIGNDEIQQRTISFIVKYNVSAKKIESTRMQLLKLKRTGISDEEYSSRLDRIFMMSRISLPQEVSSFLANLNRDVHVLKSLGIDAELTIKDIGRSWQAVVLVEKK